MDVYSIWKVYDRAFWLRSATMVLTNTRFSDNAPGGMEYLPGGFLPYDYTQFVGGVCVCTRQR